MTGLIEHRPIFNFNVIAAVARNGVIGNSTTNSLPWQLPRDLKHFKSVTNGHTIIMGANTWRSLPKALPNRRNVVITRSAFNGGLLGEASYCSLVNALLNDTKSEKPAFVIGGAQVYKEALLWEPSKLYITQVDIDAEGDVFFPGGPFGSASTYKVKVSDYSGREIIYNQVLCSEWIEDNEIRFRFTEYSPA